MRHVRSEQVVLRPHSSVWVLLWTEWEILFERSGHRFKKKSTRPTAIELHIPFPKKASAYLFAICLNLPILMLLSCKWVRKGPFIRSLGSPTRVRLSHGSMVIHSLGWRTIPLVEDRGWGAHQISPLLPIPLGWLAINLFSLKFYRANQHCLNKLE